MLHTATALAMKWGERLQDVMRQHGVTPKELAVRMHVTQGFVSHQRQRLNLPGPNVVQKIATALRISTAELLEGVEDPYDVLRAPPHPQKAVRRKTG